MTKGQLDKIIKYVKPLYKKTGKFHAWNHILAVRRNALILAKDFNDINRHELEAACYIHDIGRTVKDEGHNEQSAKIITPFLKKIKIDSEEIERITHSVICHEKNMILKAKTTEAKLLFDADKLEIMTVYGFIRVMCWLIEERKMSYEDAINFLWKWIIDVRKNYLQTKTAKDMVDKEIPTIKSMVQKFNSWNRD